MVPLDLPGTQFEIYASISRAHTHCFLFESLTGPEELAETSAMGFAPRSVVRGYRDRVEIAERRPAPAGGAAAASEGGGDSAAAGPPPPSPYVYGPPSVIRTPDPMAELRRIAAPRTADASQRYLGGAVGTVVYDAVRLFEAVPERAGPSQSPLFEFGMYDDGLLYDNAARRLYYFSYSGAAEAEEAAGRIRASTISLISAAGPESPSSPASEARRSSATGSPDMK